MDWGHTLETIGTIMIGMTALSVHHRVLNEHAITDSVFKSMKQEQIFGIIGVVLIIVGYIITIA